MKITKKNLKHTYLKSKFKLNINFLIAIFICVYFFAAVMSAVHSGPMSVDGGAVQDCRELTL